MKLEITMTQFYITGIISFLVIGVMNSINFWIFWPVNNVFARVAGFMGIVFNIALVLFFNYLRGLEPKFTEDVASDDINEIIKSIKKGKK
jgi:hypothetical protein|tara:strand:+ start:864 stop:1133 length:270 start_codon:yes stop_codon:yes gene_type:complete